jgi:tetratricopeptide (TPR) repeat protein
MRTLHLLLTLLFLVTFTQSQAQYKLYEEGVKKYNEKDYYGAIEKLSDFLTRPVRDKKFDVDAYYWRGLAAYRLNNFPDALEDLKRSLVLNHSNKGNVHWFVGKCYEGLNHLDSAAVEYSNALAILQGDKQKQFQLLSDRGKVYSRQGKTNEAIQDFQLALSLQPESTEIRQDLVTLGSSPATPAPVQKNEDKPAETIASTNDPVKKTTEKKEPTKSARQIEVPETRPEPKPVVQETPVEVPREPTLEELYKDEKRYALVIGNGAYSKQIGVLRNPVNDATDFAEALRSLNFDVTLITNASYGKIRVEMMKFKEKLNAGERDQMVGLFYYAGHGLQHDNENYLVPIDAEIQFEDDIPRFCFPIQKMILSQMEMTNSRMNIVILDACRNNPFPVLHRSIGEQAGLGEMKRARGAFIAYATAPGSVASDGTGRNGLYTQELIKAMTRPGLTIEQVFKEVRANVLRQSGERQNPWENSNIIGDFYFKLK